MPCRGSISGVGRCRCIAARVCACVAARGPPSHDCSKTIIMWTAGPFLIFSGQQQQWYCLLQIYSIYFVCACLLNFCCVASDGRSVTVRQRTYLRTDVFLNFSTSPGIETRVEYFVQLEVPKHHFMYWRKIYKIS